MRCSASPTGCRCWSAARSSPAAPPKRCAATRAWSRPISGRTDMADTALLDVRELHTGYGSSPVLHGVDLRIAPGEVVGLLGRNGMGKTTLVRAITGLVPSRSGDIAFRGASIFGH